MVDQKLREELQAVIMRNFLKQHVKHHKNRDEDEPSRLDLIINLKDVGLKEIKYGSH